MRLLKSQAILRLLNSYMVDSPQPTNLSYLWNFGSLLGVCLIIQILTGVFLAMHYTPHVDFAFNSVEHIMRDVNAGYILRYTHANVASFFFIFVYCHIARGLYYSSYKSPRVMLWSIGVIIFIVMMATAFLGYVLPYGQMSLWGWPFFLIAPNTFLIIHHFIFIVQECLVKTFYIILLMFNSETLYFFSSIVPVSCFTTFTTDTILRLPSARYLSCGSAPSDPKEGKGRTPIIKIAAKNRIGPHNKEVLNILFGSLLGDCHAEFRNKGNGTRFCFYQESSHVAYLIWLHSLLAGLGYCNSSLPEIQTRLGKKGVVRKVIRFKTWTYSSLNWVYDLWYVNNIKVVPSNIGDYLNPIALAIWIMDDGSKVGSGLKLCTNSFTYLECLLLVRVLFDNFNLKSTIQSAGVSEQYNIYIWKESMPLLREIVLPYVHPSMKYKIIN